MLNPHHKSSKRQPTSLHKLNETIRALKGGRPASAPSSRLVSRLSANVKQKYTEQFNSKSVYKESEPFPCPQSLTRINSFIREDNLTFTDPNDFIEVSKRIRPKSALSAGRSRKHEILSHSPIPPKINGEGPEKLDYQNNFLVEIPILNSNKNLKLLDLQCNFIKNISNLGNVHNLVFLDLFNNQIELIQGLEQVPLLRVLMLGRNSIKKITGIEALNKLDILDLHSNQIEYIENLNHLTCLRILNLENNKIQEIPTMAGLVELVDLNLCRNQIRHISCNDQLTSLYRLSLTENQIEKFVDLEAIFELPNLSELSLDKNPVSVSPLFQMLLVSKIPTLKMLEGRRVLEETKRLALRTAKREKLKQLEAEKIVYYLNEKEQHMIQIKDNWEQSIVDYKSKSAYVELENGVLYINGTGQSSLLRTESESAKKIVLDFCDISNLVPFYNRIATFKNLISLELISTNLCSLKQITPMSVMENLMILNIHSQNSITKVELFKPYTILILGSLTTLCNEEITLSERRKVTKMYGSLIIKSSIPKSTPISPETKTYVQNLMDAAIIRNRKRELAHKLWDEMLIETCLNYLNLQD